MRWQLKTWSALVILSLQLVPGASSPPRITPLSANRFPDKLALNVPNQMTRNSPFYFFASFLAVRLTPFMNNPDSSRDSLFSCYSHDSLFPFLYLKLSMLWLLSWKFSSEFLHLLLMLLLLIQVVSKNF